MPAFIATIGQWIYAGWVAATPFLNKHKTTTTTIPTTSSITTATPATSVTPGLGWPEPTYPINVDVPIDVTVSTTPEVPESTVESPVVTATAHVEHVEVTPPTSLANPNRVTVPDVMGTTVETN